MHRIVRSLGLGLVLSAGFVLPPSQAGAQADHLQCFKIKDALAKAEYTADITPDDLAFPASAGCTIKTPAKLLCVDAVKSNVTPTPPGADPGATAQKYLCYKAKCPKAQPTATLDDQFGTHAVEVKVTSLLCAPVPVAAPSCSDLVQNGDETDVDCGGSCPGCALGESCAFDGDCASAYCLAGICSTPPASCSDATQNGAETGVDCGGGTCPACAPGGGCVVGSDCDSFVCTGNVCQSPSCFDSVQNGAETDVDCGGGSCPPCINGQSCAQASDCASGVCQSGVCANLLSNGSACTGGGECASFFCVDGVCCNTPCSGLCQACTLAKTGTSVDGSCGNIAFGTDPDSECAGTCDGAGMCQP